MAELWEQNWTRLPLTSAVNVRELGGYPTKSGKPTLYHRYLRSDALDELNQSDAEFLYAYGVRAVLDLRGNEEAKVSPDVSLGADVVYQHTSLFEVNIADQDEFERAASIGEYTTFDVYKEIIHNENNMAQCMSFIADAPSGCVLFHCAVGKDRTGILAYLLMELAGCDRWDCISSYLPSRVHLMRDPWFVSLWNTDMTDTRRGHLDSSIETIEFAIELIDQEYGGVVPYLRSCGVSDKEINAVRARLLDE